MDEHVDRTETRPARLPLSREMPTVPASRRGYWILTALIAAGLAGGGWYLWSHPQGAQAPKTVAAGRNPQGQPQPVGFATIDRGNIRIILNELGTVASLDTVTVVTQINGQLQEIGFKEGQIVKKGDFLAQVDPRPYIAALEQAQGTLARDQGLLAQAQTNLKRFQLLGRQDSIAQQQVDDQRFLVAQYTGTVQTDQGAVDTAKLNLSYCRIVSPIDGQVGLRLVKVGAVDGGFQAVLSGLNPGDKVVTDGTDRLRDGAPISTPTARTGSPAAAGAAGPEPAGTRSPTTGVQPAVRPDTKRPPTAQ